MSSKLTCKVCGKPFDPYNRRQLYCSPKCRDGNPSVYRFVSPDGRSYVGAVRDISKRADHGIKRSNSRPLAAFEQHPPESFAFEVLEQLPYGCSDLELHKAEQRHIDRLRSYEPEMGLIF